jgi:SAM-dependent methyltransferase
MSSSYRLELDKWLANLEVKADRVLDIGGAQEQMPPRVKSWDVKKYMIADLPEPHKDSPKPDIEMDLNIGFDEYSKLKPTIAYDIWDDEFNSYDLIFCLEVFDYVWNPAVAFQWISDLLKDGGTAWVSFPSVYPLHQPVEDDALRYMPGGIVKLAESVGLSVEQMIKRRPESNGWENFYRAERMRAAKHEDHNFTGFICEFKK